MRYLSHLEARQAHQLCTFFKIMTLNVNQMAVALMSLLFLFA